MNKLNRSEYIAVGAALLAVGFFFAVPQDIFRPFFETLTRPTQTETASINQTMPIENPDAITIVEEKVGEGKEAALGDAVEVDYVGMFENGTQFDSSKAHGAPLSVGLGNNATPGYIHVIPGFEQGIVGMKVGGERTVTIPPELAYGEDGVGGVIPPNATLVFKIQLVKIVGNQK